MSEYLIVIEGEEGSYSAYVPDLPGCVTTGRTREEIVAMMREAIPFHIEGLLDGGDPVPQPSAVGAQMIEVDDRSVHAA